MNTYQNISNELKAFFSNHPIFKVLLPIDMIFLFGGVGLLILSHFVSLGSLVYGVAYWAFILGLVLTYANLNEKYLYIGLFCYAALKALIVITNLKYFSSYYSTLLDCIVFGWLGYLVFKHNSVHKGA